VIGPSHLQNDVREEGVCVCVCVCMCVCFLFSHIHVKLGKDQKYI
jgi:hypothetical protein